MGKNVKFLLPLTYLLLSSTITIAEEMRYVSDEFSITMRTGQGTQHKIIKSIKTGTKLELIETSEDGYSNVRMPNGTEGWVLTRYLVVQPVAKDRLARAEKIITTLRTQTKSLKNKVDSLSSSSSTLQKDGNRLSKSNITLKKELANIREIAANQIALNDENKSLKEQVLSLKREMQSVQQDNMSLQDRSARDWFLIGAGVCVVGIIMGLVLPNLRFRRKQSWSSI